MKASKLISGSQEQMHNQFKFSEYVHLEIKIHKSGGGHKTIQQLKEEHAEE